MLAAYERVFEFAGDGLVVGGLCHDPAGTEVGSSADDDFLFFCVRVIFGFVFGLPLTSRK